MACDGEVRCVDCGLHHPIGHTCLCCTPVPLDPIQPADTLQLPPDSSLTMAAGLAMDLGQKLLDASKYGAPQGMFKVSMKLMRKLHYYIEKAELP